MHPNVPWNFAESVFQFLFCSCKFFSLLCETVKPFRGPSARLIPFNIYNMILYEVINPIPDPIFLFTDKFSNLTSTDTVFRLRVYTLIGIWCQFFDCHDHLVGAVRVVLKINHGCKFHYVLHGVFDTDFIMKRTMETPRFRIEKGPYEVTEGGNQAIAEWLSPHGWERYPLHSPFTP
jgi:hypothetical protein